MQSSSQQRMANTDGYVGKTLAEAQGLAETRGDRVRVIGEDGTCLPRNDDLRYDRVNLYLVDGRVRSAEAY